MIECENRRRVPEAGDSAKKKVIAGGLPGQSNFYTTLSGLNRSGLTKNSLWDGLQVPYSVKHGGYRSTMGLYRISESMEAAFGTTYANPTLGAGGLPQLFLKDYSKLELIGTVPLRQ